MSWRWILLGVVASCAKVSPRAPLLDVHPIDAASTLVRWREADADQLARVDTAGHEVWRSRLEGQVVSRAVVLRESRIVTIEYSKHPDLEVFEVLVRATSLGDGRPLWRSSLGLFGTVPAVEIVSTPREATVDVLVHRVRRDELTRVDPESGSARAVLDLEDSVYGHVHLRDGIGFHGLGTTYVDAANRVTREPNAWRGCVMSDEYLYVENTELVRWPHGDHARSRRQPVELPPVWRFDGCMSYRGQLVLLGAGQHGASLEFLDPSSSVGLSGELLTSSLRSGPVYQGTATRFIPFIVYDIAGSSGAELVLVDMSRRAIVWRRQIRARREVYRVGPQWYVVDVRGDAELTRIDGETGQITIARLSGIATVTPDAVVEGVIWVRSRDGREIGRLDARSLKPLSLPPSMTVEVRSETSS